VTRLPTRERTQMTALRRYATHFLNTIQNDIEDTSMTEAGTETEIDEDEDTTSMRKIGRIETLALEWVGGRVKGRCCEDGVVCTPAKHFR